MIDNLRISHRATRVTLAALLGVLVGFAGSAQANEKQDANTSCRQETKRVAVWPKAPRAPRMARFEEREVTVCDGKVTARSTDAPVNAKGK